MGGLGSIPGEFNRQNVGLWSRMLEVRALPPERSLPKGAARSALCRLVASHRCARDRTRLLRSCAAWRSCAAPAGAPVSPQPRAGSTGRSRTRRTASIHPHRLRRPRRHRRRPPRLRRLASCPAPPVHVLAPLRLRRPAGRRPRARGGGTPLHEHGQLDVHAVRVPGGGGAELNRPPGRTGAANAVGLPRGVGDRLDHSARRGAWARNGGLGARRRRRRARGSRVVVPDLPRIARHPADIDAVHAARRVAARLLADRGAPDRERRHRIDEALLARGVAREGGGTWNHAGTPVPPGASGRALSAPKSLENVHNGLDVGFHSASHTRSSTWPTSQERVADGRGRSPSLSVETRRWARQPPLPRAATSSSNRTTGQEELALGRLVEVPGVQGLRPRHAPRASGSGRRPPRRPLGRMMVDLQGTQKGKPVTVALSSQVCPRQP